MKTMSEIAVEGSPVSAALQSHKSETRVSAIAHRARERKRKKKALLLFPLTGRKCIPTSRAQKNVLLHPTGRRRRVSVTADKVAGALPERSEERRVGKEC